MKHNFIRVNSSLSPLLLSSRQNASHDFDMHFSRAMSSHSDHLFLNDVGVETLGVLDVDGLDVRVQLLLSTLLVVTLSGDADTETVGNALDAGFPDLLVELGVEADVLGALYSS